MTDTSPPSRPDDALSRYTARAIDAMDRHAFLGLLVAIAFWAGYSLYHWVADLKFPLAMYFHLSWDEFQYIRIVRMYQEALRQNGWASFLSFSEPFGYGTLFWQIYSLLSYPFLGDPNDPSAGFLLSLRTITLFLQAGCLVLTWKILGALGYAGRGQSIAMALLAPMSGLLLLYKPFSPDYLAVFLILLAGWIALRSPRPVWLVFLLIGAGCATKLTNLLLLPAVVTMMLLYRRESRNLAVAVPAFLLGFLLANTDVAMAGTMQPYVERLRGLSAQMNDPAYMHAIKPASRFNYVLTWLTNSNGRFVDINSPGIAREFLSYPVLLFSVGTILAFWRTRAILLIGGTGLAALFAMMVTTNRVWTWYVILPVFLVAMGAAMGLERLSRTRAAIAVVGVVCCHLLVSGISLIQKSQAFAESRTAVEVAERVHFYEECVLPNRSLIQALRPDGLVVQFGVPIEPVLNPQTVCWESRSILPCVTPRIKTLLLYKPSPSDHAVLEKEFSVSSCGNVGRLYHRKDVPEKGCQGRFEEGWYDREGGAGEWWHWSSKLGKIVLASSVREKLTIKGAVGSVMPGNVLEVRLDGKRWREIPLDGLVNLTVELTGTPRQLELRSRKDGISLPPDTRTFAVRARNFVISGENSGACEVR